MATDNKSPSYLKDREAARRWLTSGSKASNYARDQLLKHAPNGNAAPILDDDKNVDWEELVKDHKDDLMVAANCAEAREAFDLEKQARSTLGPPGASKDRWIKFMSTPLWYLLRREIETADPDYWKDPANQLREAVKNPEWCCVPLASIREHLAQYLPKGETVELPPAPSEKTIIIPGPATTAGLLPFEGELQPAAQATED